jgi:membrane protease YdiL (CAAX protease family)
MLRWGAMAYAVLAVAVSAGSIWWRGELPLRAANPWLELSPWWAHAYSSLLGAALGVVMVFLSRVSVHHFRWARRLHRELRPVATQLGGGDIWMLAGLSALGEELLFRGVLQPVLGLWGQAVVFGLLHQLAGPSRWIWVTWAAAVGLLFGLLFQLTGSLFGPILAHALINGLNLSFLKRHNPDPPRESIGGLLDRQI